MEQPPARAARPARIARLRFRRRRLGGNTAGPLPRRNAAAGPCSPPDGAGGAKTMNVASTRRQLLGGSASLFVAAALPAWANAAARDPRLIVIILRGALDGLATVAPVGDPDFLRQRGGLALQTSGDKPGLVRDGWLNRFIATLPGRGARASGEGLGVGPTTPLILRGSAPVLGWSPQ